MLYNYTFTVERDDKKIELEADFYIIPPEKECKYDKPGSYGCCPSVPGECEIVLESVCFLNDDRWNGELTKEEIKRFEAEAYEDVSS